MLLKLWTPTVVAYCKSPQVPKVRLSYLVRTYILHEARLDGCDNSMQIARKVIDSPSESDYNSDLPCAILPSYTDT